MQPKFPSCIEDIIMPNGEKDKSNAVKRFTPNVVSLPNKP
jgi:hypothetical protein